MRAPVRPRRAHRCRRSRGRPSAGTSSAGRMSVVAAALATTRPSRKTVIRSVISKISSSRCETKTSAFPCWTSSRITSNSRSTSLGENDAVGSSKMMILGVDRQRLQNLDHLALARRKVAQDRAAAAGVRVGRTGRAARSRARRAASTKPARRAELRQVDVLDDAQIRREARLLHHHRDAGADRFARRSEARGSAEEPDLAAIGREVAGDDARESGLAGAIGADQRVDLPGRSENATPTAPGCVRTLSRRRAPSERGRMRRLRRPAA